MRERTLPEPETVKCESILTDDVGNHWTQNSPWEVRHHSRYSSPGEITNLIHLTASVDAVIHHCKLWQRKEKTWRTTRRIYVALQTGGFGDIWLHTALSRILRPHATMDPTTTLNALEGAVEVLSVWSGESAAHVSGIDWPEEKLRRRSLGDYFKCVSQCIPMLVVSIFIFDWAGMSTLRIK